MLEPRYTSRVPVHLSHKWGHTSETIICDVGPQYFWESVIRRHERYLLGPNSPLHLTDIVTYEDP